MRAPAESALLPVADHVHGHPDAASQSSLKQTRFVPDGSDVVMSQEGLGRGFWLKSGGMPNVVSYNRYRFPPQIIAYAVWLYSRHLRDSSPVGAEASGRSGGCCAPSPSPGPIHCTARHGNAPRR